MEMNTKSMTESVRGFVRNHEQSFALGGIGSLAAGCVAGVLACKWIAGTCLVVGVTAITAVVFDGKDVANPTEVK